jgi:hypothetical protein
MYPTSAAHVVGIPHNPERSNSVDIAAHRIAKDEFFATDPRSPIPEDRRKDFAGLAYFDPDPAYIHTVEPVAIDPIPTTIATTTGDERTYHAVAEVTIDLEGIGAHLTLFDTGHDGYFLPFRDATSGSETYGAGRYLDLHPNPDGTVTIDFNLAYAPFCAYNDAYSCALPPPGNWLTLPIRAGERRAVR